MEWNPDAITHGEIQALKISAAQAWADDTRYPRWKGSSYGGGQCYVTAVWLQQRLGGFVGKKGGHFAWLSPDKKYVLDLTGEHTGAFAYEISNGYMPYDVIDNKRTAIFCKRANIIFNNLDVAVRIANDSLTGDAYPGEEPQRQNDIDDQYWHDEPSVQESEFPGKVEKYNFFYANGSLEIAPEDRFSHEELARQLKITNDHSGPMATGTVEVVDNAATWNAHSNIDLNAIARICRDYTDQIGWDWGGINDSEGKVVSKSLQPVSNVKRINYIWSDGHLYLGTVPHTAVHSPDKPLLTGTVTIVGNKAKIEPAYVAALPQFFEWASDEDIRLYGSSNNLIERNETMEVKDLGKLDNANFNPAEPDGEDDTPVDNEIEDGIHKCPICDEIFPDWHLYDKHRSKEHGGDVEREPEQDGGFPDTDMDATNPPHFTEQQPLTMPVYGMSEASRVDGFDKYARAYNFNDKTDKFYVSYLYGSPVGYAVMTNDNELKMIYSAVKRKEVGRYLLRKLKTHHSYFHTSMLHNWEMELFRKTGRGQYHPVNNPQGGWTQVSEKKWVFSAKNEPKDLIEAAIPFIYDIPADTVTVGHPGQRTSDIPGKFTPAGIVEGMYEPGGTVNITTMTTMPYTVNHILTLWYYQYPEFSVKKINLVDAEGKKTKLANESL